jgi:hypothetical protein
MRESGVQVGQVGHPSPDPVSRTAPPVAMIVVWAMNDAQAKNRILPSTCSGSHSVRRFTLEIPDPDRAGQALGVLPSRRATL